MQNGPFNQTIAQHFGIDLSLVKQISRALREDGQLTTGARGVNAPHMTPADAARVAIAILAGSIPTTAAEDVRQWGGFEVSGPILAEGDTLRPGPFRAANPDVGCTLLEALMAIFELYGDDDALDTHVWHLGGQAMEATLSVTLSERPRSVTIAEEGAQIVFSDVQNSKAMQDAFASQAAARERFYAANKTGDLAGIELAEADMAAASEALRVGADRMLGGKTGIRVARTLTQEEIIPVARALKEG